MIDFNVIDSEIAGLLSTADTWKTTVTGRIREVISINEMPSLDISAQGHETAQDGNRTYTVPVIAVITRRDYARTANASAFKDFVMNVCTALEDYQGAAFDVVRNIRSEMGEEPQGDGRTVRTVIVRFNVLAH